MCEYPIDDLLMVQMCYGVQVGILDQQNKLVATGKIGEVCIQGPNVTKGYLNRPEANEEAFAGLHLLLYCVVELSGPPADRIAIVRSAQGLSACWHHAPPLRSGP